MDATGLCAGKRPDKRGIVIKHGKETKAVDKTVNIDMAKYYKRKQTHDEHLNPKLRHQKSIGALF